MLRMRHQRLQKAQGKTMDNRVNPADLNALERHILKEALRQARKVQRRMTLDYGL
jgi:CBS domain-containing protein